MTRSALVALAAVAGLALGCGDAPSSAPAASAEPRKKAEAVAAEPDAGVSALAQYAYNPLGKRDPFKSPVDEAKPGDEATGDGCREPLCQWDLEQLNLVAIVSGDANPIAMVEDPNRIGHLVRRNARMGKQGGKVTQILRDCIVVTEYWTTPDGKLNPNPVKVCIAYDDVKTPMLNLMNGKTQY